MGRFGKFAYSSGRWSTDGPTAVPFLLLDIHDGDVVTVDYRCADASGGRFFLGYEPRFYFGEPDSAPPVDTAAEAEGLAAWARADGGPDVDPADRLADGSAMDSWKAMVRAQGGDPDADLPVARHTEEILAPADGVLTRLDAYAVGVAAWRLGAGRARKEDPVQAGAGIELHAKPGDTVTEGQPLLTLHTETPEKFEYALKALPGSYDIAPAGTPFAATPVVRERIA